jgi:hypothetical protein
MKRTIIAAIAALSLALFAGSAWAEPAGGALSSTESLSRAGAAMTPVHWHGGHHGGGRFFFGFGGGPFFYGSPYYYGDPYYYGEPYYYGGGCYWRCRHFHGPGYCHYRCG